MWGNRSGQDAGAAMASYSQLAMRLEHDLASEDHGCSIYVAAADDETVAVEATAELAWFLAEEVGREVLMIDGSFGKTGLSASLGASAGPGLTELLAAGDIEPAAIDAAAHATGHPSVRFIHRGQGDNGALVPARARTIRQFLDAAARASDFVLVQGATVMSTGRSLAFGPAVDAVLLVALEEKTQVSSLEQAQDVLSNCGAQRIGLVLASAGATRT